MKNKFLSNYDKEYIRTLFIERLISYCDYAIKKEYAVINCPDTVDYGDDRLLKPFIERENIKVDTYAEIILATTSPELETIPEILNALGYDGDIYLEFKELVKKYK